MGFSKAIPRTKSLGDDAHGCRVRQEPADSPAIMMASSSSSSGLSSSSSGGKAASSWHLQLLLVALSAATCYTTFWLPYPHLRPSSNQNPPIDTVQTIPAASMLLQKTTNTPLVASSSSSLHLLHARASPYNKELRYQQQRDLLNETDPLQRYYAQQGFADTATEKYLAVLALALVLAWFVWDCVLRQQWMLLTGNSSNNNKRIQNEDLAQPMVGLDLEQQDAPSV